MEITLDKEAFPDAKPGDTIEVLGEAVVSDTGDTFILKTIEVSRSLRTMTTIPRKKKPRKNLKPKSRMEKATPLPFLKLTSAPVL